MGIRWEDGSLCHCWKAGLLGAFALLKIRFGPEPSEAVTELRRLGIRVAMITGDSKTVAVDSVARRIGIDEVAAECSARRQGGGSK